MKDWSMINNREIARRSKISEKCIRNTLKTFKMTGGILHHAGSRRLKKLQVKGPQNAVGPQNVRFELNQHRTQFF